MATINLQPCILSQPSIIGMQRTVVHDIPVAVVPERLWANYQEPDMPDIDVRKEVDKRYK